MSGKVTRVCDERRTARAAAYLAIPRDYTRDLGGGLRWSAADDVIEFADGSTFAFASEIVQFLEGFAAQRPLVPFGCVLRLLYLLRPRPETPAPYPGFSLLRAAFRRARGSLRNAGVFAALLCRDVPPAPDPPEAEDVWRWRVSTMDSRNASPPDGETPPLVPPTFEARVRRALEEYDYEEMVHWLGHGCGPERRAAEQVAQAVVESRPPTLGRILADVAQRGRLSGAVPFVAQLVSALTLPPRRLSPPELPLGGYADVATRGHLEQVLPSQLAYDDLEFVRRLAQRELLFFRREDPHVRTREDLVVLLDQGVRTWGIVRLVLSAAVFALGRMAERRGIPFLVATTRDGGELHDPLAGPVEELGTLLEASDLGANPGLALERVLEEETTGGRDVVLLTHPRSLAEEDVVAAARRVRPGTRLFAVAVNDRGEVQHAELRRGVPAPLGRFRIDLEPTPAAPAPARVVEGQWRGDVERVPYPFQFGIGSKSKLALHFAFDRAGEWLLAATAGGYLYAMRTDGSRTELLPRGAVGGRVVDSVAGVLGVAGGFVVTSRQPLVAALHYDFVTRTCKAHDFRTAAPLSTAGQEDPALWHYLRWAHTLVLEQGEQVQCLHLSTGSRELLPEARALFSEPGPRLARRMSRQELRLPADHPFLESCASRGDPCVVLRLPLQDHPPGGPGGPWSWPALGFVWGEGMLAPAGLIPDWEAFTPLSDGQPLLRGAELLDAVCQGHTLAALFRKQPGNVTHLRLFRGPEGTPLAEFPQPNTRLGFALSSDGRLLARQVRSSQVEVRDVVAGGPPSCLTPRGRFHHDAVVVLGDKWLSVRIDQTIHRVHWSEGRLDFHVAREEHKRVFEVLRKAGTLEGTTAKPSQLPPWLQDQAGRFRAAAVRNLIAAVDRFSQVALFEPDGTLVCMFFAFRQQIAAWMPDGTCCGPAALLGRPATPGAEETIGRALLAAWERGAGRTSP
jgi:hypothetical protein